MMVRRFSPVSSGLFSRRMPKTRSAHSRHKGPVRSALVTCTCVEALGIALLSQRAFCTTMHGLHTHAKLHRACCRPHVRNSPQVTKPAYLLSLPFKCLYGA